VDLSLPMAADIARYMNAEFGDPYQNIISPDDGLAGAEFASDSSGCSLARNRLSLSPGSDTAAAASNQRGGRRLAGLR